MTDATEAACRAEVEAFTKREIDMTSAELVGIDPHSGRAVFKCIGTREVWPEIGEPGLGGLFGGTPEKSRKSIPPTFDPLPEKVEDWIYAWLPNHYALAEGYAAEPVATRAEDGARCLEYVRLRLAGKVATEIMHELGINPASLNAIRERMEDNVLFLFRCSDAEKDRSMTLLRREFAEDVAI